MFSGLLIYTDYSSSAAFQKSAEILLVSSNYAKNYASTSFTEVVSQTGPSTNVLYISKLKFGCTSIKCLHDNSPVLLAAVEFVMETFD